MIRSRRAHPPRALRVALPLALLASLLGPLPIAQADLVPTGSPPDMSAAGEDAYVPQLAIDSDGDAVVAWSRYDGSNYRIQVRRRTPWGGLGAAQTLSAAGKDADEPQLAVDRHDAVVVVWRRYDGAHYRIQVRRRTASGNLSAVQTLSAAGEDAFDPQVALDPDGNALVVWWRYDGTHFRIQARRRTASGGLSAVQTLSAAGRRAVHPQVAMDPDGKAVVVWTRSDGSNDRIQARRRTATGNLSAVQTLSPAGQDASDPQVAMDPDGNAVVVWRRSDGANWRIQARRRTVSGGLSAAQTLSAAGQDADKPQVGVDPNGKAVLVWTRSDGANDRVEVRRRTPAGSLSAVQTLSAAGQDASWPQVAVDRNGTALVVWSRSDGANYRIEALSRTAAGSLSTVLTLSAAGQNAANVQVAVDRDGNAVAVYERDDGSNSRVQASYLIDVQTLSAAGQHADIPQVAVDRNGNAVVVWTRFDGTQYRIQARRRTASGVLSAVQTLSAAGEDALDPHVAMDPDGNAVVVWRRFDGANWRIQARRRATGGGLSAVQSLSAAGRNADLPQLAVDANGRALVVWERYDGSSYRVQARRRTSSGRLSAVQTLSASGQNATQPQVAVDSNGNAVVVWARYDGANFRIEVERRTSSGGLSLVRSLSAAGQDAFHPQLAMDPDGNAVVVWERADGMNDRIQARRRTSSGGLSAVQTLSASGQDAIHPQVAVDGDGNAVVVWARFDGSAFRIEARRRAAGGGLSAVQILSAVGHEPQLAMDRDGNAVVVWSVIYDGLNSRIQARRRTPSGSLSAVLTLSAAGLDSIDPQVGVDSDGKPVVVWRRFDGTNNRIQASRLLAG
jgi:hypothetical protein